MLFLWTVVCTVSGCRRKWLNLAIVFWVNLVLQYILLTDTCLFLLCFFQLFSSKPGDWLERTSPKWPVLCQLGRKTTTQINHATMSGSLACVHVCAWRACVSSDDYFRMKLQWKSIDADQESRFTELRDRRSLVGTYDSCHIHVYLCPHPCLFDYDCLPVNSRQTSSTWCSW